MKKGVTLKDLARKLNMSVSTVSKALGNDSAISAATRERVQKLALEWHYVPNEAARHFKQNKTYTLGLIIPNLLDQFYVLAINGVEEIAAKNKYNVIVTQTHENEDKEKEIIDIMIRHRVDGIIIAISKNTHDTSSFQKLVHMGIPVIFFARPPLDPSFNYVSSNNRDGSMKAMEYLFKRGHKRIAHLMGPAGMALSQQRYEGYKKALEKKGIAYDSSLVKEIDLTRAGTFRSMKKLMSIKNPPTAIFAFKNYVSLDVINFLKKYFPSKVSRIEIAGFGNLPLIQHLDHKPVASIEENSYLMGIEAAQLLFKNMVSQDDEGTSYHIKVPCRLVVHH